jgi:murein DD-endopeptidase MepM/ murein hydrolase activator NlpD
VIGQLDEGTLVQGEDGLTSASGRRWRHIVSPRDGFVANDFLDPVRDEPREATGRFRVTGVGSNGLNLRSAPGLGSTVIGTLDEGDVVEAEDRTTPANGRDWRRVVKPRAGFVAASFLDRIGANEPVHDERLRDEPTDDGPVHPEPTHDVAIGGYVFPVRGYDGPVNLHHGEEIGGCDLMAERGTPVVAMHAGLVDRVGFGEISGNFVSMTGDDGLDYWYAHGDAAPSVRKGQRIAAGTFLFPVGDSGNAGGTGTHLHIGIGHGINAGAGPSGGCGLNFDAVDLLRRVLRGHA